MRHRVFGKKFGRSPSHRKAMFKNMVTALVMQERIETTVAKAKAIRRIAEKMVTLGKRGTLHARRLMFKWIRTPEAVAKVYDVLAKRFATRPGGYTRIFRTWPRAGDAAPMSIIEFLPAEGVPAKKEDKAEEAKLAKEKAPKKQKKVPKTPEAEKPKKEKKVIEKKQPKKAKAEAKEQKVGKSQKTRRGKKGE